MCDWCVYGSLLYTLYFCLLLKKTKEIELKFSYITENKFKGI